MSAAAKESGPFGRLADVRNVLADAVKERQISTVLLRRHPEPISATFVEINDSEIILQPMEMVVGSKGAAATVMYASQGRSTLFQSEVSRHVVGQIRLVIPRLVVRELRLEVRLRIAEESGLEALVSANQHRWSPRVVDLSTSGVRLAFDRNDVPEWSSGTMVRVRLALGMAASVTQIAVVVRRSGCEYGLAFDTASLHGGSHQPNRALKRLMTTLARHQR